MQFHGWVVTRVARTKQPKDDRDDEGQHRGRQNSGPSRKKDSVIRGKVQVYENNVQIMSKKDQFDMNEAIIFWDNYVTLWEPSWNIQGKKFYYYKIKV